MLNWEANVFPGILGRICDRPCEPVCRRGRVEKDAVAICRLKRVAADYKGDVLPLLPGPASQKNGKRIVCVGGGPASLTVARDLLPLGYDVVIYEMDAKVGGMMRTMIPRFRLPEVVLEEELGYVIRLGPELRLGQYVKSLKVLLDEPWDAIFVGCGAPRGRELDVPGRAEARERVHLGLDWLANVSFGHTKTIGKRVMVLGGGNTAMDCCRSARRLGGQDVEIVVRSGFEEMKASKWEREEAMHEGIRIHNYLVPKEVTHNNGQLTGIVFEKVRAEYDAKGRRSLVPTGEAKQHFACDDILVAVGQENTFPWIERDIGIEFDKWDMPKVDPETLQSTLPKVIFGGDAAFGPKNIITAVAHGHQAAITIDKLCRGEDVRERPEPKWSLVSQKMGIHEWTYDNEISNAIRHRVPTKELAVTLRSVEEEVEFGFDPKLARAEAARCLNCDIQTVFFAPLCYECDACVDICPTDCITFTANGDESELRLRLKAPSKNLNHNLYIGLGLKTGRIMVKDEDVCLHCGLCAERCPTAAWDMQKLKIRMTHAGDLCHTR
jgi:NADPH-dependent glutamate synthase beta subunit-like oxidoreductase